MFTEAAACDAARDNARPQLVWFCPQNTSDGLLGILSADYVPKPPRRDSVPLHSPSLPPLPCLLLSPPQ